MDKEDLRRSTLTITSNGYGNNCQLMKYNLPHFIDVQNENKGLFG